MKSKKLVVFDLDGTLNRTDLHAVPSHAEALKEYGVSGVSPEEIKSVFGVTPNEYIEYIKKYFPDFTQEELVKFSNRCDELELENVKIYAKTYDGVPEMLDTLHSYNIMTAVCSNSSLRYISAVLNNVKIESKIDYIMPIKNGLEKKDTLHMLIEKVNPSAAIMVGDTHFDLDAANANNIPFIGCLYGFRPNEMEKCRYNVKIPIEIAETVKHIFEIK